MDKNEGDSQQLEALPARVAADERGLQLIGQLAGDSIREWGKAETDKAKVEKEKAIALADRQVDATVKLATLRAQAEDKQGAREFWLTLSVLALAGGGAIAAILAGQSEMAQNILIAAISGAGGYGIGIARAHNQEAKK